MIIFDEHRPSDSPFVERIWRCHSEGAYPFLSIAESRSELVVSKLQGKITLTVRGPETKATPLGDCPAEGEWLGIQLKLGTFLPPMRARTLVDAVVTLPEATSKSFWLNGSAWQFPDYENADTFVDRLVREDLLVREPVVAAVLQGQLKDLSLRSVQRRFVQAAGVTHKAARQIERARYATLLLQQGVSIVDTIEQAGYFDQPHLTRSLKRFIGQTPAQLLRHNRPEQLSFLYKTTPFSLRHNTIICTYQWGEGSQTLIEHDLVDEFRLMVYPIVLGNGKRLFKDGTTTTLKPTATHAFSSGVVALTYQPAGKEAQK